MGKPWAIVKNPHMLGGVFEGAATGLTYLKDRKIEVKPGTCFEMALAHELAHAIEITKKRKTSEFSAWALAKSFLKPKYWHQEFADRCYQTYVDENAHRFEYLILEPDHESVVMAACDYPDQLPGTLGETEGVWLQIKFTF